MVQEPVTELDQATMQRMDALLNANKVRKARAADKKKIKAGRLSPSKILRDQPEHWASAKIIDLLLAMDSIGTVKAMNWLRCEMISPTRKLDTLTARQAEMMARHVDVYVTRRDHLRDRANRRTGRLAA